MRGTRCCLLQNIKMSGGLRGGIEYEPNLAPTISLSAYNRHIPHGETQIVIRHLLPVSDDPRTGEWRYYAGQGRGQILPDYSYVEGRSGNPQPVVTMVFHLIVSSSPYKFTTRLPIFIFKPSSTSPATLTETLALENLLSNPKIRRARPQRNSSHYGRPCPQSHFV